MRYRLTSPSIRLTFGLVFLTSTIVVLADFLGLTPDPKRAELDARMKLVETITVQAAEEMEQGNVDHVRRILAGAAARNAEILSVGLRSAEGALLIELNNHGQHWTLTPKEHSTAEQIQVPIFKGNDEWGHVEFHFKPFASHVPFGIPVNLLMTRMLFFALTGYILYFLFLKHALKYLDPSSAVPEHVKAAMNTLSEGVLILDEDERIVLANDSFINKTQFESKQLLGKKPSEIGWTIDNKTNPDSAAPWRIALTQGHNVSGETLSVFNEKLGNKMFVVNATPIISGKGKPRGALATFDDVTLIERKNAQLKQMLTTLKKTQREINLQNQKLSVLASTDPLTGCLNRRAFFSIVKNSFEEAKNSKGTIASIMLDIDFFKKINDNYGHSVGDLVLSTVADCLKNALRKTDLLCRYGGEEFCIILRNSTISNAQGLAERIRESVEKLSFGHNPAARDLRVSCSFGVSDSSFGANDVEQLIDQADQSLYVSKETGRNRVTRFDRIKETVTITEPNGAQSAAFAGPPQTAADQSHQIGDDLTGFSGRHAFLDSVNKALEENKTSNDAFAVLIIDIDHLRRINTSLGYAAGDRLIREVGDRLSRLRRGSDLLVRLNEDTAGMGDSGTVSRLGSDEFGLLVRNFGESNNVYAVAKRITQSLAEPLKIDDQEMRVSVSIGISVYPDDGETCEQLVNSAERALVKAKHEGGNIFLRSALKTDPQAERLIHIEMALQNALEKNEFRLFFQPKVDLKSLQIVGMEALIRWQHDTLGDIPPSTFIPIAENTGLIKDIGNWVLRTACAQTKLWHSAGFPITTAVNVSTLQLTRMDFFAQFSALCSETGLDPQFIEIEITESILMENFENVVDMLLRFHSAGVKIAVDDFGVGYSSLSYIKRLPIHMLKIDRSFVKDIASNKDDAVIVSAIIAMARAMNLKTVAEGVEDDKQLRILRRLKCDEVQGYLLSKPVDAEHATALLHGCTMESIAERFAQQGLS